MSASSRFRDTNVISELRKANAGKANRGVVAWANGVSASNLFLSVMSILELEIGIQLVERRDPTQGANLRAWMNAHVLPTFADRTLVVDLAVVQCCAKFHVPDPCSDRDAIIAATALVHGLTVVTRHESDFLSTKVPLLNPWC